MTHKQFNIRSPKITNIIINVLYIILGIVLMIFPGISLNAVCYLLGAVTLALGFIRIIGYFSKDLYCLAFQFDLAMGIFTVIFGLLLLLHPAFLASVLPFFIGMFILISALLTMQTSRDSKSFGIKYWWVLTIISALSAILGILLIFNPFKSAVVIMSITGAALTASGIEKLVVSFITIKRKKNGELYDENGYTEVEFKDVD